MIMVAMRMFKLVQLRPSHSLPFLDDKIMIESLAYELLDLPLLIPLSDKPLYLVLVVPYLVPELDLIVLEAPLVELSLLVIVHLEVTTVGKIHVVNDNEGYYHYAGHEHQCY